MCGIVAYIGKRPAAEVLLDGLSRLEYRGYDSAGIAVVSKSRELSLCRAEGRLSNLRAKLGSGLPAGHTGIGHTRWATHGRPSEANAHPHAYEGFVVVHNGIIENFAELRQELCARGHIFSSETDSEIIAHLIADESRKISDTGLAFRLALRKLRGSYAVVLLRAQEPASLYAARSGSPLVLGLGEQEHFIASDVPALLPYTREVVFLEEGDCLHATAQSYQLSDLDGQILPRTVRHVAWTLAMAEKAGYKHFMLKEIFEQPRSLADTLRGHVDLSTFKVRGEELENLWSDPSGLDHLDKVYLVACGSSWHAGLAARFGLEKALGVPVLVEQASEFRYRDPRLDDKTLVIAISQSGETADTLMAARQARQKKARVLAVSNGVDSSLARESQAVFYTYTGPEIGVAATKTFTSQIAALHLIALFLGEKKRLLSAQEAEVRLQALLELPGKIEEILKQADAIRAIALRHTQARDYLFIGRGPQVAIALEGALKLKEISYLHAEGYAAGELKHGPIALIEKGSPVVAMAFRDAYYEKMISNLQEVLSRQASVIALASEGDANLASLTDDIVFLPAADCALMPILSVVPLQLLAYYIADGRGYDVDQPRNLAKSVTVE